MSSGQARLPVSPVLVVASENIDASRRAYELLLGVDADAPLTVDNATIELRGGTSEEATHRALFGTEDFAATTRLLRRRGLALTETSPDAPRPTPSRPSVSSRPVSLRWCPVLN